MMYFNTREVQAYKASVLDQRKQQAQKKKNAKKKKGVNTTRACWTVVSVKHGKKTLKQKKGTQHEDFPRHQPS